MNEIEKFSKYIRESVNEGRQAASTLTYDPRKKEYKKTNNDGSGYTTFDNREEMLRILTTNHFLGPNGESPEQVAAELDRSKQPQPIIYTHEDEEPAAVETAPTTLEEWIETVIIPAGQADKTLSYQQVYHMFTNKGGWDSILGDIEAKVKGAGITLVNE